MSWKATAGVQWERTDSEGPVTTWKWSDLRDLPGGGLVRYEDLGRGRKQEWSQVWISRINDTAIL